MRLQLLKIGDLNKRRAACVDKMCDLYKRFA